MEQRLGICFGTLCSIACWTAVVKVLTASSMSPLVSKGRGFVMLLNSSLYRLQFALVKLYLGVCWWVSISSPTVMVTGLWSEVSSARVSNWTECFTFFSKTMSRTSGVWLAVPG
ncbi:hypothetical protein FKM82_008078 [Ascaphus truei]